MRRLDGIVLTLAFLSWNSVIIAQPPQQMPAPQAQHDWLRQFVGEWVSSSKSTALPGQPAMECSGTMSSHMLGGFWIVNNLTGDIGGAQMRAIQTIGFDPAKRKYVGTWVDSMMNHMWHYEGVVDATGKKLVLEAEGPNFMANGKMTQFRDSYEFKSADHIVATSEMLDQHGKWLTFMTGDIRRK